MGFVAWKDAGLNTYGNTVIVNGDYLKTEQGDGRRRSSR